MRHKHIFDHAACFGEGILRGATRLPSVPATLEAVFLEAGFDADAYRALYADLRGFTKKEAITHAVRHGMKEGRQFVFKGDPPKIANIVVDAPLPKGSRDLLLWTMSRALSALHVFALAEKLGLTPLLIVGDSHSNLYFTSNAVKCGALPILLLCTGGSARGLSNPKSRSGYGLKIARFLADFDRELTHSCILFKFGQVDVEFVFNFHRVQTGKTTFSLADFHRFRDETIRRYMDFLGGFAKRESFAVASIFPPALGDAHLVDGYLNEHVARLESDDAPDALKEKLRALETPDLRQRTRLHNDFNMKLRDACAVQGLIYCDDFSPFLSWNGLLARKFNVRTQGADHHLDWTPATEAVIGKIISRLVRKG